jgi:linoleoyl-CoA desaturase
MYLAAIMSPFKPGFANNGNTFYAELRQEIDLYFSKNQKRKTGNGKLYRKTAFALIGVPVLLVVSFSSPFWGNAPMWLNYLIFALLGAMHAFTGFNVMHDACHGSFSSKPWINNLFQHSIGLLGSHAPIWKFKHNVLHHTWTNVDGVDDDIAKSPMLRHCPTQTYKPVQKYQHLYMFGLYAISTIWWLFGNDSIKYAKGQVNQQDMPKMTGVDHLTFWGLKLLYAGIYVAVPIILFGTFHGLMLFLTLHVVLGIILSVVFQLAHAVEGLHFENAMEYSETDEKIANEWAVHQVLTTNNFATKSPFATWFMGGLNFQVEHHLFPKISHVHYPDINPILIRTCEKYGVKYSEMPTFWAAIGSHLRWMRLMGSQEQPQTLTV